MDERKMCRTKEVFMRTFDYSKLEDRVGLPDKVGVNSSAMRRLSCSFYDPAV